MIKVLIINNIILRILNFLRLLDSIRLKNFKELKSRDLYLFLLYKYIIIGIDTTGKSHKNIGDKKFIII